MHIEIATLANGLLTLLFETAVQAEPGRWAADDVALIYGNEPFAAAAPEPRCRR